MALLSQSIAYARTLVRDTNVDSLTDAVGIEFANDFVAEAQREFVKKRKALRIVNAVINVVSGTGLLTLPDDCLLIRTAAADLTGRGFFPTVNPYPANNIPTGWSLQSFRAEQPVNTPLMDVRGLTVELFPTPTASVTGGFVYQYHQMFPVFTAGTDTLLYPFSQDFYALAYGIASKYLEPLNNTLAATYLSKSYKRISDVIDVVGTGTQMPTQARSVQQPGVNAGWCS